MSARKKKGKLPFIARLAYRSFKDIRLYLSFFGNYLGWIRQNRFTNSYVCYEALSLPSCGFYWMDSYCETREYFRPSIILPK